MDGGGGGPSSQTITQSNIPDWLRPQVESLIGGATQQLFNYQVNPETGKYEITGTKPWVPYSANPEDYVADLSPLQRMAMGNSQALPGMAADLMSQQAGAGGRYEQMATDPGSIQKYMSPYMQNVVDVQQQRAQREADIAGQSRGADFARAGAFGGARQNIQDAQANAALARQKQDIQARGLQDAFQNAQTAQQFGSKLGLEGLSGAQQGFGNVVSGINTQAAQGAVDQQQNQNIINRAVQNYDTAQQYPMQQMQQYNGLLRGYYTPSTTTTTSQAAPSMAQQAAGLGMGAYGMSKMAKGGIVALAEGGLTSIDRRVLNDPTEFSEQQIRQSMQNGVLDSMIGNIALSRIAKAKKSSEGLSALPTNLPEQSYAPGGIVAFTEGGTSKEKEKDDGPSLGWGIPAAVGAAAGAKPVKGLFDLYRDINWMNRAPSSALKGMTLPGAAILAGGIPATNYAARVTGASPELRKGLTENIMLGALGGDTSLASAIMNEAKEPDSPASPYNYKNTDFVGPSYTGAGPKPPGTPPGTPPGAGAATGAGARPGGIAGLPGIMKDINALNMSPEQYFAQADKVAAQRSAEAEARLRPEFTAMQDAERKAAEERYAGQEALGKERSALYDKQEAGIRKNEEGLTKDREQAVGLAFLQAARAMTTGRKPFLAALADAGATGGESFIKSKEKIDEKAQKVQEALMKVEEARLGGKEKQFEAKAELNTALAGLRKGSFQFASTVLNMGRDDAQKFADISLKGATAALSGKLHLADIASRESIVDKQLAAQKERYQAREQQIGIKLAQMEPTLRKTALLEAEKLYAMDPRGFQGDFKAKKVEELYQQLKRNAYANLALNLRPAPDDED